LHFFVHFGEFGRIHGPQTSLSLAAITRWLLYLLKTLIQTQVVADGVFPSIWSSFEVWEMFATAIKSLSSGKKVLLLLNLPHEIVNFRHWQATIGRIFQSQRN
jgi:hypothetical protein